MKNLPLWTAAIPIITIFASLQIVYDFGERGTLQSPFLREHVYPVTRILNGTVTNIKFRLRGPTQPKNKIVIVEADESSLNVLGRWPWHREVYAQLIHAIFKQGAKTVALDVGFSEPEERIPPEIYKLVEGSNPDLASTMREFEGDPTFAKVISHYKDRLVLGYGSSATCQPGYSDFSKGDPEECPYRNEKLSQLVDSELAKFALPDPHPFTPAQMEKLPLNQMLSVFSNIPMLREQARYSGYFNIEPDPDGYVRRYPLVLFHKNKVFPAIALQVAEIAKGRPIKVDFDSDGLIQKIYFDGDPDDSIPTTPLGNMDMNFRGKRESFKYVGAVDVLSTLDKPNDAVKATLDGAHVFFGASAIGIYDMRAFPFDSNVPGVEGHVTALDNILSGDALKSANNLKLGWLVFGLLIILGIVFALLFSRFEARPALLLFFGFFCAFGLIDIKILFEHNINLPSGFLFLETLVIFILILSIRYIREEQNKKFVKDAFSKYLAPQVVDLVLKDPTRLTVGGERKELTILFSDLRGFTTFSEGMDPKTLSQFLNEYLSEMTEIIFEYEGTLDKYIGDAVMAFWGAPLHQDDHALKAWNAAVAMQKRLREIAPDFKEKYGITVSTGVGLNSGEVSVGNMGSKRIFEYTVIGDHVNLASRLESLTRMYGCDILSTTGTVEFLPKEARDKIAYRIIDSVIVKGKKQAVDLIQICEKPLDPRIDEKFVQAKAAFKNREWDLAISLFTEASTLHRTIYGSVDGVSEMFISRTETFKESPPGPDWNGTIEMRSK